MGDNFNFGSVILLLIIDAENNSAVKKARVILTIFTIRLPLFSYSFLSKFHVKKTITTRCKCIYTFLLSSNLFFFFTFFFTIFFFFYIWKNIWPCIFNQFIRKSLVRQFLIFDCKKKFCIFGVKSF